MEYGKSIELFSQSVGIDIEKVKTIIEMVRNYSCIKERLDLFFRNNSMTFLNTIHSPAMVDCIMWEIVSITGMEIRPKDLLYTSSIHM